MGERGPLGHGQGHRNRRSKKQDALAVPEAASSVVDLPLVPDPPAELSDRSRNIWVSWWSSPQAGTFRAEHLPALERLIWLYDDAERCAKAAREEPTVEGSMGQTVVNPLAAERLRLQNAALQLEKQFGFTLMSQLRLGIKVKAARDAAKPAAPDGKSKANKARPDPRLADPRLSAVQQPAANKRRKAAPKPR